MIFATKLILSLVISSLFRITQGCSIVPPCGVIPTAIELTDIEGIVHVTYTKYTECDSSLFVEGVPEKISVVEVDTNSGIVRREIDQPWEGTAIPAPTFETVDQTQFTIEYITGGVKVTSRMVEVEYSLPDFAPPLNEDNMEGVVPFYSSIENKIYFIYSSIDGIRQMASCYLSDPYECTVEPLSEFDLDFFGFKKNSIADARVYDEFHLVGIPSLNSCVPSQYYVFDRTLLANKISTLGSITALSIMDGKTAYAASGFTLKYQSISEDSKVLTIDISDPFPVHIWKSCDSFGTSKSEKKSCRSNPGCTFKKEPKRCEESLTEKECNNITSPTECKISGCKYRKGKKKCSARWMMEWPDCIEKTEEECSNIIRMSSPDVVIEVVPPGFFVTTDYKLDRVRIYVDEENKCCMDGTIPTRG